MSMKKRKNNNNNKEKKTKEIENVKKETNIDQRKERGSHAEKGC